MKNRVLMSCISLLAGLLLLGGGFARADDLELSENTAMIDGKEVRFDSYLIDGHNYVQIREFGEAAGMIVEWDESKQMVLVDMPDPEPQPAPEPELDKVAEMLRILAPVLGVLLVCAVGYALWLRSRLLAPLQSLKELTGHLDELGADELSKEADAIAGEPGDAARKIAAYASAKKAEIAAAHNVVAAPEVSEEHIIDEICQSLLPQEVKENAANRTFSVSGGLQHGTRMSCSFYDYFLLNEKTLCTVVGQVPGDGIAEALFAVVAQTAIRSRLRMGLSLVETMSDVNAQLYDLGGRNSVCALVSILNTTDGRCSFVNAGGATPFLMRSEGKYEYLRTPVYAPLGANESVSYRSEKMRLNQGDRLFLYTGDMAEMMDRDGQRFGEQAFQAALNRSRSQARSMEETLRFVQDEAAAYCESGHGVLSSAAISLEYEKGNRDYIFTQVPGTAEYAPVVTEFMRKTLVEGGVSPKEMAKQVLLSDELFALCCRASERESDIKVECAIRPDENTVSVRMFAPMGGKNPLESSENASDGNAANYIRTHTRSFSFQSGLDRDAVEFTSELS